MEKCQLLFLHEHKVEFVYAHKQNDYYKIVGYYHHNRGENFYFEDKQDYFYVSCLSCKASFYPKKAKSKTFKITHDKMDNLKNYLDQFDNIIEIISDNNKIVTDFSNYYTAEFYQLKSESQEDNIIYIGTDEEKKNHFYSIMKEHISKSKEYKSEASKLLKKNEKLVSEKKNLSDKYDKIYSAKADLQSKYNQIEDENINLKEDKNKLEIKKNQLEENLSSINSRITFLGDTNNEKETYHIVISILSMINLSKEGWKIRYPKGKEEYLNKANKKTMIIGVVGNGNKGKSFILGKLSGYDVPQGFTIRTEGLSIRYGDEANHCVAILDSAGQETPLLKSEIKINNKNSQINSQDDMNLDKEDTGVFETCLRDKLITETYIQKFIMHTSHVLVLVIGAITLNEQKILERVKKSLDKEKYLYVIHNLQNFQAKIQVEDYIENTLKKLFGVQISEINFQNIDQNCHQKYYVEEKNNKITHLIFVNDYSPIAKYYNDPVVEFLKKKLDVEQNRVEFSVIEKCKEYLIKIHSDFLEGAITNDDFLNEEDKIIINPDKEIKLKKVFIDEIGKTITNYTDEPNYYYYSEGKYFNICIELPGEGADIKTKLERSNDFYIFDFKGTRPGTEENNNEEHKIKKNLVKPSEIKLYIRIPLGEINILQNKKGKLNYDEKIVKNGIFKFKYLIEDAKVSNDYE